LHAACSVHEHKNYITGFKRLVDLLQHAAVQVRTGLVHARSIDKDDLRRGMHTFDRLHFNDPGDAIARGLRFGGDNGHLFASESVEQRAFAGVGTA